MSESPSSYVYENQDENIEDDNKNEEEEEEDSKGPSDVHMGAIDENRQAIYPSGRAGGLEAYASRRRPNRPREIKATRPGPSGEKALKVRDVREGAGVGMDDQHSDRPTRHASRRYREGRQRGSGRGMKQVRTHGPDINGVDRDTAGSDTEGISDRRRDMLVVESTHWRE